MRLTTRSQLAKEIILEELPNLSKEDLNLIKSEIDKLLENLVKAGEKSPGLSET
jgi:hypothetical protein